MIDKKDLLGDNYNDNITEQSLLEEKHNVRIAHSEIKEINVPGYGYIVEYGSWRGAVVDALSEQFGKHRVFGFDISNFMDHPQVHKVDVRHLSGNPKYNIPIALAWNDLSEWVGSPIAKQASFDHALNNLVDGGIYIEHRKSPEYILSHPNLSLIRETKHLLFFKYHSLKNE